MTHLKSAALLAFAYSGMLKWVPLPIDVTALTAMLLIAVTLQEIAGTRRQYISGSLVCAGLMLGFLGLYVATAVYSISGSYWLDRSLAVALDAIAFVGAFIIIRDRAAVVSFLQLVQWTGCIVAAMVLALAVTGELERVSSGAERAESLFPDYLRLGLLVGGSLVVSVLRPGTSRVLSAVCCGSSLLCLGGRGPALAAVLTVAVALIAAPQLRALLSPWRAAGGAIAMIVVALIWATGAGATSTSQPPLLIQRLSAATDSGEELERSSRVEIFATALKVWGDRPWLGTGIGGYGLAAYNTDREANPHNVVLEVAAETGIIGLFAFSLGAVCLASRTWRCFRVGDAPPVLAALLVFYCLNYLKSSGFVSARDLYTFAGAVASPAVLALRQISGESRSNSTRHDGTNQRFAAPRPTVSKEYN